MNQWKPSVAVTAVILCAVAAVGGILAPPVWAQVRAALAGETGTAASQPFRGGVDYNLAAVNDQRLLTTVPAGKRLVIEHLSFWSYGQTGDELTFGALRTGQRGAYQMFFEIHPVHTSATGSLTLQDGSQPVTAYFEAGEEVWVSVSHSTPSARHVEVRVQGQYVTP
jgi:hypothetical protein